MTDTIVNSFEMDGLIAGDFPIERDIATIKLGQNLERGSVVAPENGTPASKISILDGPYNLNSGENVVLDVDNTGDATAAFTVTAAQIIDTTTYPVADQAGKYIDVTITGGEWDGEAQRINFLGAHTTAAQIVNSINAQIKGASANEQLGQVRIVTDGQGTDYDIAVDVGTSGLTFGSPTAGGGDVGDINAITPAEVKTHLELKISGMTVTVVGNKFKIETDSVGIASELDFDASSTGLTKLGLAVEIINGTDGSGYWLLCDKDAITGAENPAGVLADDCDASIANTSAPIYRTGTFDAAKLKFAAGTVAADLKEAMAAKSMFQKTTSDMI